MTLKDFGNVKMWNCWVYDDVIISGNAKVSGKTYIDSTNRCVTIGSIGSRNGTTTFCLNKYNYKWMLMVVLLEQ